jgi:chorismate mutase / prephenate dehydratase
MSEPDKKSAAVSALTAAKPEGAHDVVGGVASSTALSTLRDHIDQVDDRLLALLNERAKLAQQIGQAKRAEAEAKGEAPVIYRPEREAQVLRRLTEANTASGGLLPRAAVEAVFHEIMSAGSAMQRPIRVAYLGPKGTFSESAAIKQFGRSAAFLPCANFDEAFRRTETGETDFSVVPVENSTEGTVSRVLDLLLTSPLSVCAEIVLPVNQQLMRNVANLDGIKKIVSHAQSLAQTQGWLARHLPAVERVQVVSNAEAARLASLDESVAAIAGRNAAEEFGLHLIAENIEDDPTNRTKFVVVGKHMAAPSGKDRTWLVMSAPNVAGAVHKLLTPIADNRVSMSKLESRPARHVSMPGSWEYLFYVELEGHQAEPHLARAVTQLRAIAPYLKIFGSYPAAL